MKATTATTSTNLDIGNDHITYEDSSLERKIRLVTEGLSHQYSDRLYNKTQKGNAMAIIDFILSMKTEINVSSHHVKTT